MNFDAVPAGSRQSVGKVIHGLYTIAECYRAAVLADPAFDPNGPSIDFIDQHMRLAATVTADLVALDASRASPTQEV